MSPARRDDTRRLLLDAAERSTRYLESLAERRVAPEEADVEAARRALGGALPETPTDAAEVLALLDRHGSPATMASAGGRFFGFVIGGALPVTVAASWLANAWDQNAGLVAATPISAVLEDVALDWLTDVLGLPAGCACGFVTSATLANFAALAAARHALLERAGWDVEARGLFGAPPLTVLVGDEVHASVLHALSLVGLGKDRVTRVPVDGQGRLRADALPALDPRTIVCIQAGNVNTGAFDPAAAVCERAREAGAWVHVDGAFGLWAAASPRTAHLADGVGLADSWATDSHKWLNVPYDSGLVFTRDPAPLRGAMASHAAYLIAGERREPSHYVPELSRRARGIEVWAAMRALGRSGLAELVDRTCRHARRFAAGLREAGHEVLSEVVLNQVLVAFGDAERTRRVIAAVQREGTCWCGGTEWQGRTAMRISVSSWATTEDDVERSLAAILRLAAA